MSRTDPLQISESELRAMTAQMNEMHAETFPALRDALADMGAGLRARMPGRRGFLIGAAAVVGGAALAACGSDTETPGATATSAAATTGGTAKADLAALATNASLENLAVFAYGSALTEAPKGKFGANFPAAVAEFATNAKQQHTEHAQAFNAALTNAGAEPFTKPDPVLAAPVTAMFGKVTDVAGLAALALTLENTAAATYIQQMGTFTDPAAIAAVATIAPVERQHAAILSFVLGDYPVPDTFVVLTKSATSLGARPSTDAGR